MRSRMLYLLAWALLLNALSGHAQSGPIALVKEKGQYGFVNRKGNLIFPDLYTNASRVHKKYFEVEKEGKWVLINRKQEILFEFDKADIRIGDYFHNGYRLAVGGLEVYKDPLTGESRARFLYGIMNQKGIIIKPQYLDANAFSEGVFPVKLPESGWGYVNLKNEIVISARFENARSFSEGLAAAKAGGKWGFIDHKGAFFIEAKFDSVYPFHEGLAAVKMNNKYAFINKKGNLICDYQFDMVKNFSNGYAGVNQGGHEEIRMGPMDGLFYASQSGGQWGFIDKQGQVAIPLKFSLVSHFSHGLAAVGLGKRMGLIDHKGEFVVAPQFFAVGNIEKGIAVARLPGEDLYGYINARGKWVIKPQFEYANDFE